MFENYKRRLRIWEANYGRDAGWVIEWKGHPIANLMQPRNEDMFWESYSVEVVTQDPTLRQEFETDTFWANANGLEYRSRTFGDFARDAFSALSPFPEPGRLSMRGLYLNIGTPKPWDQLLLWLRRVSGRRAK